MINGTKAISVAKTALLVWGGVSLVLMLGISGYACFSLSDAGGPQAGKATKEDVRFVLNCSQLGDERIENVVNSYTTSRSITGDHLDAYEIKITDLDAAELNNTDPLATGRWYKMDSLPKVLDDAIDFVDGAQHEIPWFPVADKLRSDKFFVYPSSIVLNGTAPISAQLIFAHLSTKKIYYVSLRT